MAKSKVLEIYELGDITISKEIIPHLFEGQPCFRAGLRGSIINRIYPTLDMAMIGALAVKYDGHNTQADKFICRTLGIEGEYWT